MAMEDTRRRNELSIARKRLANSANPAAATGSISADGPTSPSSSGAMDSLLEKLRAAAPQARDQRDRRRRARLKDRHQVRVASGQKIPDLVEIAKGESETDDSERGLLSPTSALAEVAEHDSGAVVSESEDVADRAASMLQGLRGDSEVGDLDGVARDSSLRVRRRRESADDERKSRRRRRGAGNTSTSSVLVEREASLPTQIEEQSPVAEEANDRSLEMTVPEVPATMVSPPSPEGTQRKPVEIED